MNFVSTYMFWWRNGYIYTHSLRHLVYGDATTAKIAALMMGKDDKRDEIVITLEKLVSRVLYMYYFLDMWNNNNVFIIKMLCMHWTLY